jgi:hypothetical protein
MTLPRYITKTAAPSWVAPGGAKDATAEPDSRPCIVYVSVPCIVKPSHIENKKELSSQSCL